MTQGNSRPGTDPTALRPLIVCLAMRYGGVDVRVIQSAREFARRGIPYGVAVLAGSQLHERMQREGLACHPIARRRSDPRVIGDLVRIARSFGANVIDPQNMQSLYHAAIAARLAGIPGRVATVHSVYKDDHPEWWRRQLREGALRLCKAMGFSVIAVSSEVKTYTEVLLGIPSDRVTLSWNGIEPLATPPAPINLGAETGWQGDVFVLGMISRLEKVKGHATMLTALSRLVKAGETRLRLFIAGEGREEAAIRAQVQALGLGAVVHFAGFRSDVTAILPAIDLFCLPSLMEGLPFSVLEACRQGVPVIASEFAGAADLFTDGRTIVFVPIGDAEALADRIAALLQDRGELARIAAGGRDFIDRELLVGPMIDTVLEVYSRAIAR